MNRKKALKKSIGFQALDDADADIIAWWEALPGGDRSQALRDIIRGAIGRTQSVPIKSLPAAPTMELIRVCDDTAWIRSALTELPSYLEQMFSRVAVVQTSVMPAEIDSAAEARLAQEAMDRRRTRMKQSEW